MKNNSCMIKGGTNMNRQDFYDGKLFDAYRYMGAHKDGDKIRFVTYAPRASRISIIGEFNNWNEEFMEQDAQSGFFLFYSDKAKEGQMYKYCIYGPDGNRQEHCDPYGFEMELRPGACSIIRDITTYRFNDRSWMQMRSVGMEDAINIYEMHMGSWRMNKKDENGWYQYDEIAKMLVPYLKQNNYTHVELMPLSEHPFDGSWGYQNTGFFAPTKRYGTPDKLMKFVDMMHQAGIGVIMDFVPVHFAVDGYGLKLYDGTPLYEYDNKDTGESEWGSCNFIHSRREVQCFLQSAANYWLEEYHFDGIRMDAVSRLIYWQGDESRGVNDTAIDFLKAFNLGLKQRHPTAMLIAEDSTAYPGVTEPVWKGGLGFDYKWDLGWMHDTLEYFQTGPEYRSRDYHKLTFSMVYFWNERYMLEYCHDEVVHGKATILQKMYGDYEDKFPQARAMYMYMMIHPGKKLNFMGNEFGHPEWIDFPREGNGWSTKYARRQWSLPDTDHLKYKFLREFDRRMIGFEKQTGLLRLPFPRLLNTDQTNKVLIFSRGKYVFLFSFSPQKSIEDYEFFVPQGGDYRIVFSSDDPETGGFSRVREGYRFTSFEKDGADFLSVYLPSRMCMVLEWLGNTPKKKTCKGK